MMVLVMTVRLTPAAPHLSLQHNTFSLLPLTSHPSLTVFLVVHDNLHIPLENPATLHCLTLFSEGGGRGISPLL